MKKWNSERGEKIILIASAFLLMAALTTTGIYMKTKNKNTKQDGYVVDFSAIEKQTQREANASTAPVITPSAAKASIPAVPNPAAEIELDYDPEYHSSINEPSLSDTLPQAEDPSTSSSESMSGVAHNDAVMLEDIPVISDLSAEAEGTEAISMTRQPALNFHENDTLKWPIVGDVLINFSMDKTVYYPTLDQYKYNPGIVIAASQGETITAPATGRVISISQDPQYGNMVKMDLGGGYELSCGQLDNLTVSEGSFVEVGENLGCIAAPTKYFTVEGSNLFLQLTKDGVPISPLSKLE